MTLWCDKNDEQTLLENFLKTLSHELAFEAIVNLYEDIRCLKEQILKEGHIPMPKNRREAECMALLGESYLKNN